LKASRCAGAAVRYSDRREIEGTVVVTGNEEVHRGDEVGWDEGIAENGKVRRERDGFTNCGSGLKNAKGGDGGLEGAHNIRTEMVEH